MTTDYGYLQHGKGTNGPFRTEQVAITERGRPYTGQWLARFEGRWRVVYVQVNRLYIVYRGQKIDIQIEGV
jgi:hypothetical protein